MQRGSIAQDSRLRLYMREVRGSKACGDNFLVLSILFSSQYFFTLFLHGFFPFCNAYVTLTGPRFSYRRRSCEFLRVPTRNPDRRHQTTVRFL